jgi:small conductance mechanosensitive channel
MFQSNTNTTQRIIENAWTVKDITWKSINDILQSVIERLPYILAGLLVLLLFWLLGRGIKAIFWSASDRTKLDNRLRILFTRLIGVLVVMVGVFAALSVIIPAFRFSDLITSLGFTSFIIGFATKDILNNLLSGVLILWQQPFRIGDYLFVGNNQGKVEYIGVRATQLRKDDGELILIPNGDMYSSAITIRGAGAERRMILKISIGYDCDVSRAKEIISRAVETVEGVVANPQPSAVVTDLTAEGVNISIYFWINTDKNKPMLVLDKVATEVKTALDENDIVIYPPSAVAMTKEEVEKSAAGNANGKKKNEDGL